MIPDQILHRVLHTDHSRAMWGDVIRGAIVLAAVMIAAGFLTWYVALGEGVFRLLAMNDFGKFYYSARMFLEGRDMYGPSPATLIPVGDGTSLQFWNMNPPHFHLLVLPLALLAPAPAFAIWGIGNLLSLLAAIRLELDELRVRLTGAGVFWGAVAFLVFAGTGTVVVTGQLSFLLLLLLTAAWLSARHERWLVAGAWLGVGISIKPFLLVFLAWLVLRRHFTAAVVSVLTASACFAAGLVVFGRESHAAWLGVLSAVSWPWAAMNGSWMGVLSRVLDDSPYFTPVVDAPALIRPLWIVGTAVIGAITLFVVSRDRTANATDRAFFLLPLAAQLISPLGWVYYLWLALPGGAALLASRLHAEPSSRTASRWRDRLALAALPAMVWPFPVALIFQPRPWATIIFGCIYFWGTLALWGAGIADWRASQPGHARRAMAGT